MATNLNPILNCKPQKADFTGPFHGQLARLQTHLHWFQESAKSVNKKLLKFCNQNNWQLIQHGNITRNGLNKSGLHLNDRGNNVMFINFVKCLNACSTWSLDISIESAQSSQDHPILLPTKTVTSSLNTDFINSSAGFKIAALNIASLPKHIDELRLYTISQPADILAINETRLDSSVSNREISIPGYTLERKECNRTGAGVALYIKNSISYEYMPTLQEKQLEWLCVKVIKPKAKPFIVGTWYRPPGSTSETMSTFESLLVFWAILTVMCLPIHWIRLEIY